MEKIFNIRANTKCVLWYPYRRMPYISKLNLFVHLSINSWRTLSSRRIDHNRTKIKKRVEIHILVYDSNDFKCAMNSFLEPPTDFTSPCTRPVFATINMIKCRPWAGAVSVACMKYLIAFPMLPFAIVTIPPADSRLATWPALAAGTDKLFLPLEGVCFQCPWNLALFTADLLKASFFGAAGAGAPPPNRSSKMSPPPPLAGAGAA